MKLLFILAVLTSLIAAQDELQLAGTINCQGSANCMGCKQPLGDGGMLDFVKQHLSDDAVYTGTYAEGKQIACKSCYFTRDEGLCVTLKNVGDRTVTGKFVKDALQRLRDHGCKYCGWERLWPGIDAGIKVDYVVNGCIKHGDKIC
ncbi:hypothetical protein BU23DRAFT_601020 [Bimuria novae-zelandiae CBS 107.79]|uniref:Killer toxin Kp4 domain-containing protein n=1 Tax=Bimuria novae-zelandiae CBS 107.79 TaxID=1447943 RepID=A0A6A5UZP9_9PLEO|nr:hypothetical protein BU23DRAFT_601020 [Bimuria novae-zelandiae CBS 107.79]